MELFFERAKDLIETSSLAAKYRYLPLECGQLPILLLDLLPELCKSFIIPGAFFREIIENIVDPSSKFIVHGTPHPESRDLVFNQGVPFLTPFRCRSR